MVVAIPTLKGIINVSADTLRAIWWPAITTVPIGAIIKAIIENSITSAKKVRAIGTPKAQMRLKTAACRLILSLNSCSERNIECLLMSSSPSRHCSHRAMALA